MGELKAGLYESLVTRSLQADLDALSSALESRRRGLSSADAADRIAWHVSKQIERALLDVDDSQRVAVALSVARGLLDRLGELAEVDQGTQLVEPAAVLSAILRRLPDGKPEELDSPVIHSWTQHC